MTQEQVEDQAGRFKIWAGNLGAFQRLPSTASLDYRLKDSPKVAAQVQELLQDLHNLLKDVIEIGTGRRPNRQPDTEDDDDPDDLDDINSEPKLDLKDGPAAGLEISDEENQEKDLSEAEELFESIKETITSLFRISMIIRHASPRDRFAKALSAKQTPFDESFDINHVKHKYPLLDQQDRHWLAERLGKAITNRRQFLRYAREHRDKLAKESKEVEYQEHRSDIIAEALGPAIDRAAKSEADHTVLSKPTSTLAPTSASTLLIARVQTPAPEDDLPDDRSQTSYAISIGEDDDLGLQLPKLADVSKDGFPFECPLCWTIQNMRKERSWRKHAFSDLRPYVCTYEKCDVKLFSDRRDWFDHELEYHRGQWTCCFCNRDGFHSLDRFQKHMPHHHEQHITDDQLAALCEASRRPVDKIPALDCPFCTEWEEKLRQNNPTINESEVVMVMPHQFRKHVGAHMQQLALFAIPRGYIEGDGDAGSGASVAVGGVGNDKVDNSGPSVGPSSSGSYSVSYSSIDSDELDLYDPTEDVEALQISLSQLSPDCQVLIDILSTLQKGHIMKLRDEYKRKYPKPPIGYMRREQYFGLPEHIRMRIPDVFGRLLYVKSLGPWESECYWIDQWLMSGVSTFAIEALIGRGKTELQRIIGNHISGGYDSLRDRISRSVSDTVSIKSILMQVLDNASGPFKYFPTYTIANDLRDGMKCIMTLIYLITSGYTGGLKRGVIAVGKETIVGSKDIRAQVDDSTWHLIMHAIDGAVDKQSRDAMQLYAAVEKLAWEMKTTDRPHVNWDVFISRLVRLHWDRSHMASVLILYQSKDPGFQLFHSVLREGGPEFLEFCAKMTGLQRKEASLKSTGQENEENHHTASPDRELTGTMQQEKPISLLRKRNSRRMIRSIS